MMTMTIEKPRWFMRVFGIKVSLMLLAGASASGPHHLHTSGSRGRSGVRLDSNGTFLLCQCVQ